MKQPYTITGYTLRVAVLYQDRVTFLRSKNTWREVEHVVGPEYGKMVLVDEVVENSIACAAVLNKHETDAEGKPMWNGLQAIGATVIGYGANIKKGDQCQT